MEHANNNQYPIRLYKYMNLIGNEEDVEDIILKNQVYFRRYSEFNEATDIFAKCGFYIKEDNVYIRKVKEQTIKNLQTWMKTANKSEQEIIKEVDERIYKGIIENISKPIKEKFNECALFSMFETNNSVLLWSHYADLHRGICLIMRPKIDNDILLIVEKVNYSDEKPSCEVILDENGVIKNKENVSNVFTKQIFFTKTTQWKYENEWRILMLKDDYYSLPQNVLEGVIIGCKIDENGKKLIERIATKANITQYKAIMNSENTIEIKQIN